jgi:peptidoglycan/LPS O-acetylase OafA/YrhL
MSDSAIHGPALLNTNPAKNHITSLDGIRGIAIILVLLVHLTPDSHVRGSRMLEWIYKFAWSGWIGVDLFFVLSGFLITGILLNSRQEPHYFRNFYMRRVLRIFPLYFGVLFVLFGIMTRLPFAQGLRLQTIAHNQAWFWLYATNFGMALHPSGSLGFCSTPIVNLSPFWSLAVEEHFYLIWPAIVWFSGTRSLKKICWAFIAMSLILRIAALMAHPPWLHLRYSAMLTPMRVDGLAAGSLLAISVRENGGKNFFVRHRGIIWIACALFLTIDTFAKKGLWQGDPLTETIGISVIVCLAAATLALALFARSATMQMAWSHPTLRFMGKYSYGIYVYHSFLQSLMERLAPAAMLARWVHQPEIGDAIFMALCTFATLPVAMASYHFYERPFLALKKYFASGSTRAPEGPSEAPKREKPFPASAPPPAG